jgi:transcriptional regulator GlxA family with amidase domain
MTASSAASVQLWPKDWDIWPVVCGGLSSGTDLALHMVGLRFGGAVVEHTATTLGYQGTGWLTNTSSF